MHLRPAAPLRRCRPIPKLSFGHMCCPINLQCRFCMRRKQGCYRHDGFCLGVAAAARSNAPSVLSKMPSVIGNGIAPAFENMFASPEDLLRAKQNRAAYTATPYRGLSVLVRAMQGFDRDIKLDVFSSMRVYQAVRRRIRAAIAAGGAKPCNYLPRLRRRANLARHLRETAFLFYPSIYPETFCITAAEAMAAGMKVVTTQLGALEETTMGFAEIVPVDINLTAMRWRSRFATQCGAPSMHLPKTRPFSGEEYVYAQVSAPMKPFPGLRVRCSGNKCWPHLLDAPIALRCRPYLNMKGTRHEEFYPRRIADCWFIAGASRPGHRYLYA